MSGASGSWAPERPKRALRTKNGTPLMPMRRDCRSSVIAETGDNPRNRTRSRRRSKERPPPFRDDDVIRRRHASRDATRHLRRGRGRRRTPRLHLGRLRQSTDGIPHFDSKYEVEVSIAKIGVHATVLAPVYFMENIDFGKERLAKRVYATPLPPTRQLAQVAVADSSGDRAPFSRIGMLGVGSAGSSMMRGPTRRSTGIFAKTSMTIGRASDHGQHRRRSLSLPSRRRGPPEGPTT